MTHTRTPTKVGALARLLANQDGWGYSQWHLVDRKARKVYFEYAHEILEHLGETVDEEDLLQGLDTPA